MRPRTASRMAWGAAAVALSLAAVGAAFYARNPEHVGDSFFSLMLGWTFPIVGAVVASRRPENPLGWIFLVIGLCGGLQIFGVEYGTYGLITAPGAVPLADAAVVTVAWVIGPSFGLLITFVLLLFPTGGLPSRRWRPVAWASGAGIALMTAGLGVHGIRTGGLDVLGELGAEGVQPPGVTGVLNEVGHVLVFFGLAASVVSLFVRRRRASREERQQLRWFALAASIVAIAILLSFVVGDPIALGLEVVGTAAIPVAMGIAVLRYRLYDIDLVINKTLVYGALAVFITAVYVGVVVGIGYLLGTRGDPNVALQIAATALVAVAFQPVRSRVQRLANRVVYGERATPYEVMVDFGGRIAGSLRVEDVLPRIAEVAARAVGATSARVRLQLPGGHVRAVAWPEDDGEDDDADGLSLEVVHQGERVGEIAVVKAAGDALRAQDERLLRDLAAQSGLALHNVRLTQELQSRLDEVERAAAELETSRARLVRAEDRERRRIETAIERGAERALRAMLADLRRVEATVSADPDDASRELERLGREAAATLDDLRDLARGIYPPLLADQGLAAALEAQARKIEGPVELRTDGIGRYGEELEAGMYFCCLELLREPGPGLRIELEERDGHVHLRLERTGEPDPEAVVRIADRVEALDGTLAVDVAPPRTVISAWVPARSAVPPG